MAYRAEKLEDLDWTFHKDGVLQRETLVKRVLSTGAWPVIAYLYRMVKNGIPEDKQQICLIRYARKKSRAKSSEEQDADPPKIWVPHHRLNLPSTALAWRIAAQIIEWAPPNHEDGGFFADVTRLLRDAATSEDTKLAEQSSVRRRAAWARRKAKETKADGQETTSKENQKS